MALNLDAIKNRLSQLQNTTTKQSRLWRPQPGKNLIRIVPYKFNRENPFMEMHFHYGMTDADGRQRSLGFACSRRSWACSGFVAPSLRRSTAYDRKNELEQKNFDRSDMDEFRYESEN